MPLLFPYNVEVKGTKKLKEKSTKFMTIKHYEKLIEYFKKRNEESYIFLFILAITGARFSDAINMVDIDLNEKDGIIHLRGTKPVNADRFVEVSQKDIKLIKSRLAKLPKRVDGKLFKLSHTPVAKSFNHAKKETGLKDDTMTL